MTTHDLKRKNTLTKEAEAVAYRLAALVVHQLDPKSQRELAQIYKSLIDQRDRQNSL